MAYFQPSLPLQYTPITYYWIVPLILDDSYLVGNLTNLRIAETKALELLKSWHFCISNLRTFVNFPTRYEWSRLGALSNNRWSWAHVITWSFLSCVDPTYAHLLWREKTMERGGRRGRVESGDRWGNARVFGVRDSCLGLLYLGS